MSTTIEWTDETWNPVAGCDKVSPGCDHCYAENIARRFAGTKAFPDGFAVTLHADRLEQPFHWRRPRRVFVNSMSDLFHPKITDEYIARVFAVMQLAGQHQFQVLTKRAKRMFTLVGRRTFLELVDDDLEQIRPGCGDFMWPAPNVWLGVSIETDRYTFRADYLSETPAAVIAGGESGPGARPMDPEWARGLRDDCVNLGVPFFFKQWGGRTPKAGGRELDGRTWDEFRFLSCEPLLGPLPSLSNLDDLRTVIELACLTEDRANDEQKALLRLAIKADQEANRLTATNKRTGDAWRLHRLVEGTRELVDNQRHIRIKDEERQKLDWRADNWDRFHEAFQRGEWTPEMAEAGA